MIFFDFSSPASEKKSRIAESSENFRKFVPETDGKNPVERIY